MLHSQASVATPQAGQFLFKLAKHFAKKVPVRQEDGRAEVDFAFGHCLMQALEEGEGQVLRFDCQAPDTAAQERLHGVLAAHLDLMTRREPLTLRWQARPLPEN